MWCLNTNSGGSNTIVSQDEEGAIALMRVSDCYAELSGRLPNDVSSAVDGGPRA